jgi:multiple sugar transport system substrate-binding protein
MAERSRVCTLNGITWDHPRGYAPLEALGVVDGIGVRWERRSLREFGDTPVGELAAAYDLMIIDHPHIGMAAEGLRALDGAEGIEEVLADNGTLSRRSYVWEGRTLALPVDAACQVGAWRPDVLPAFVPPESWAEVILLAETLRKQGQWVAMALCPTDCLCSFLTLAAQGGTPPTAGGWMPDRAVAQALERLCQLHAVCHPESVNWNPIQVYERMSTDDTLAYVPFAFGYTDYQRSGALQFGPIPGRSNALLGGAGISVSAKTRHPAEAERIACVLSGRGYQTSGYTVHGGQPAHAAAWADSECDRVTGGFLAGTRSTLERAWMRPRDPRWPPFQEALGVRIHAFLVQGSGVAETVESLRELHASHFGSAG